MSIEAKYAEKDLYGYKRVLGLKYYWQPSYVRSDKRKYPYNTIIYDTKPRRIVMDRVFVSVTQGYFHSDTKCKYNKHSTKNIICVPKGTEYFEDVNGKERCSREIIVFKKKTDYLLYKMFGVLRPIKNSVSLHQSLIPVPRKYRRKKKSKNKTN